MNISLVIVTLFLVLVTLLHYGIAQKNAWFVILVYMYCNIFTRIQTLCNGLKVLQYAKYGCNRVLQALVKAATVGVAAVTIATHPALREIPVAIDLIAMLSLWLL